MANRKIKVAYLLTHPIQYQTPLLRLLTKSSTIELHVFYRSKKSLHTHTVPNTTVQVKWDVPLMDGYDSSFLSCVGRDETFSFFRPLNYGFCKMLRQGKFDILWIHGYTDYYSLYALCLAKILGIKTMVRGESTLMSQDNKAIKKYIRRTFFKVLNKIVNIFLYVGTLNYQFYRHYKIPENKLVFCPYTVDNKYFEKLKPDDDKVIALKKELNLDPERPVILFASRMITRKHQIDLLDAYIQIGKEVGHEPFPYLLFIGDGEPRDSLEKQAKETGWSSIKFLGYKNQSELPLFYAMADVFVLPSERENWGLVVNEAMSARCAIVASDQIGGAIDLVKDNENGHIFETRNVNQLCLALKNITQTKHYSNTMGQNSYKIIQTWGIQQTAEGVEQAANILMQKS